MQQQRTGRPTQTPNSLSASLPPSPSPTHVHLYMCVCVTICNKSLRHECNSQPSERPQSVAHTVPRPLGSRSARLMRFCRALLTCCRGARGKGNGGKGSAAAEAAAELHRCLVVEVLIIINAVNTSTDDRWALLQRGAAPAPAPAPPNTFRSSFACSCCCFWSQLLTKLLGKCTERNQLENAKILEGKIKKATVERPRLWYTH